MTSVSIRGLTLGDGQPKVIVPLVEATEAALLATAREATDVADIVEWRVDRFEGCRETARVLATLHLLRAELDDLPLLFTIRTSHEGGEWKPSSEEYRDLIADACTSGEIDLVDVQYLNPESRRCFRAAKNAGIPIVASVHDFKATPPLSGIMDRLDAMAAMGANVCKVSFMPLNAGDVLAVLEATWQWSRTAAIPLISMSMGALGVVTRVSGGVFGSCATFASLGGAISAPGQLPIDELRRVSQIIQRDRS